MDNYYIFITSAYGVAFIILLAILIQSILSLHKTSKQLKKLKGKK